VDVTAPEVLTYAVLIAIGVVQSFEDIDTRRVHVLTTRMSGVWVFGMLGASALVTGETGALIRMVLCALALWGIFAVLDRVTRGGIGRGDRRLAPVIGAATGYLSVEAFAFSLLAIAVVGFVLAVVAVIRAGVQTRIPFVPVMYGGVLVAVIAHG
jgi:leader peptidase (prepilin peptidase)/N-methyltransferase